MSPVCILCLKSDILRSNKNVSYHSIEEQDAEGVPLSTCLKTILPELVAYLGIVKDPKICNECYVILRLSYNFRQKCLRTNKIIGIYFQEASPEKNTINLKHVIFYWVKRYQKSLKKSSTSTDIVKGNLMDWFGLDEESLEKALKMFCVEGNSSSSGLSGNVSSLIESGKCESRTKPSKVRNQSVDTDTHDTSDKALSVENCEDNKDQTVEEGLSLRFRTENPNDVLSTETNQHNTEGFLNKSRIIYVNEDDEILDSELEEGGKLEDELKVAEKDQTRAAARKMLTIRPVAEIKKSRPSTSVPLSKPPIRTITPSESTESHNQSASAPTVLSQGFGTQPEAVKTSVISENPAGVSNLETDSSHGTTVPMPSLQATKMSYVPMNLDQMRSTFENSLKDMSFTDLIQSTGLTRIKGNFDSMTFLVPFDLLGEDLSAIKEHRIVPLTSIGGCEKNAANQGLAKDKGLISFSKSKVTIARKAPKNKFVTVSRIRKIAPLLKPREKQQCTKTVQLKTCTMKNIQGVLQKQSSLLASEKTLNVLSTDPYLPAVEQNKNLSTQVEINRPCLVINAPASETQRSIETTNVVNIKKEPELGLPIVEQNRESRTVINPSKHSNTVLGSLLKASETQHTVETTNVVMNVGNIKEEPEPDSPIVEQNKESNTVDKSMLKAPAVHTQRTVKTRNTVIDTVSIKTEPAESCVQGVEQNKPSSAEIEGHAESNVKASELKRLLKMPAMPTQRNVEAMNPVYDAIEIKEEPLDNEISDLNLDCVNNESSMSTEEAESDVTRSASETSLVNKLMCYEDLGDDEYDKPEYVHVTGSNISEDMPILERIQPVAETDPGLQLEAPPQIPKMSSHEKILRKGHEETKKSKARAEAKKTRAEMKRKVKLVPVELAKSGDTASTAPRKRVTYIQRQTNVGEVIPTSQCVLFTSFTGDGDYVNDHDYLANPYSRNRMATSSFTDQTELCVCLLCNTVQTSADHMKHMQSHTTRCSICGVDFYNVFILNLHVRFHMFKCRLCLANVTYPTYHTHDLFHKTRPHNVRNELSKATPNNQETRTIRALAKEEPVKEPSKDLLLEGGRNLRVMLTACDRPNGSSPKKRGEETPKILSSQSDSALLFALSTVDTQTRDGPYGSGSQRPPITPVSKKEEEEPSKVLSSQSDTTLHDMLSTVEAQTRDPRGSRRQLRPRLKTCRQLATKQRRRREISSSPKEMEVKILSAILPDESLITLESMLATSAKPEEPKRLARSTSRNSLCEMKRAGKRKNTYFIGCDLRKRRLMRRKKAKLEQSSEKSIRRECGACVMCSVNGESKPNEESLKSKISCQTSSQAEMVDGRSNVESQNLVTGRAAVTPVRKTRKRQLSHEETLISTTEIPSSTVTDPPIEKNKSRSGSELRLDGAELDSPCKKPKLGKRAARQQRQTISERANKKSVDKDRQDVAISPKETKITYFISTRSEAHLTGSRRTSQMVSKAVVNSALSSTDSNAAKPNEEVKAAKDVEVPDK